MPHKPVTSGTVFRGIKDKLSRGGVDIGACGIYNGHSCRCSSSSKTRDIGITIRDILRGGCWRI